MRLSETKDVYFGVGLQKEELVGGKRGGVKSVVTIPGVWCDINIKSDGHTEKSLPETLEEAIKLANFTPEMPPSRVIHSGGGLHAYWLFKEPWVLEDIQEIEKAQTLLRQWQETLNAKAREKGWNLDNTSDLARVLRVPGSFNYKDPDNPVLVKVMEEHSSKLRYDPDDFEPYLIEKDEIVIHPMKTDDENYPLADAEEISSKCRWIKHCFQDAAALSEPSWYAMLIILARCEDGEQNAINWSRDYPKYSLKETKYKFQHALQAPGPYTCEYIEKRIDRDACTNCVFKGKIKSPIVLGRPQSVSDIYDDYIEDLNKIHSTVMLGGKCVVMNEVVDPISNRHDINFSGVQDFKTRYSNSLLPNPDTGKGQSKEVSVAKVWLDSPMRKSYDGIVFSPGKEVPGYYNLYKGLDAKPKKGDWSLFQKHIYEIIAGGDQDAFNYITAWMAHLVQDPGGKRAGTAIVLRGKQGTGKGCFVSQFGAIFGNHYLQINNQNQITGRFNHHLKNALLVFCDEGIWAGDKSAEGVLKGMVTEDQIMVEPKGKDPFPVVNHIRLIVASNNDWVIPAGLEERRFFVLDVSDKHMQDKEYFRPLFQQMNNGGREAMLYDLLQYDISGVDFGNFPRTAALLDQIIQGMTPVQKFWFDKLMAGKIGHYSWGTPMPCKDVYEKYIEYAQEMGVRYKPSVAEFGKQLKNLCPKLERKRKTQGGYTEYYYFFPSLDKCRKEFEAMIKMTIDWDDE